MTNGKNKGRQAAKAALAASLGLATLAGQLAPTLALAAVPASVTYGTGKVTIKNVQGNVTSFKAYQIFKANKNDDGTAKNIQWTSNTMRDAVLKVLDEDGFQDWLTSNGHTDADAHGNAEYAAQYIASKYTDSTQTTLNSGYTQADQAAGNGKVLDSAELLNRIAAAADDVTPASDVAPETATTLAEGYWVIVTDGATIGENEDGTSPIFALVGAGDTTVIEKTTVPTLTKDVKNDASGSDWGKVADSESSQDLDFRLIGTIASNYATYDSYSYKFTDDLSAGLTASADSVKVTVYGSRAAALAGTGGTDITTAVRGAGSIAVSSPDGDGKTTLTVDLSNLKLNAYSAANISKDSAMVVTYKAHLDPTKAMVIGGTGNPNTARITYSSNPNTEEKGDSKPDEVRDYAYKLRLNKVDRDTGEDLEGAKFTIQATGADEGAGTQYVQADGSLSTTAYEFTTDSDGIIAVSGLDAGTYTVHETTAPAHFELTSDFTFSITPTYDGTALKSIAVTTAGNADVKNGIHEGDGLVTTAEGNSYIVPDTGEINLTVGDVRRVPMPVTGAAGIAFGVIAGGSLVGLSLAGIIRRGKREDASEE